MDWCADTSTFTHCLIDYLWFASKFNAIHSSYWQAFSSWLTTRLSFMFQTDLVHVLKLMREENRSCLCAGVGSDRFHRCQCITGKHRSVAELPLVRRGQFISSKLTWQWGEPPLGPSLPTKSRDLASFCREDGWLSLGSLRHLTLNYLKSLKSTGWPWLIDRFFFGLGQLQGGSSSIHLSMNLIESNPIQI